ncbi:MAG: molybdopterin-guanine dinucleotide biosynthesis protein B [Caldimicrobium sp.]
MPQFLAISGFHNSGKTRVGEVIVKNLIEKGYKVAVVKSTKEEGLLTDKEKSDTCRYRLAGSQVVSLLQKQFFTLYYSRDLFSDDKLIEFFEKIFWEFDIILLEGFKNLKGVPKIWVIRDGDDVEIIKREYPGIELFTTPEDTEDYLSFVETKLIKKDAYVSLWVNSKKIFLKEFIQVILKNIIFGFLRGLKDIPEKITQIEVKIKK